MNSKLAAELLKSIRGEDFHIYPEHVRNLPIAKPTFGVDLKISALCDEILAMKKSDSEADTSALEAEIDQLVYKLYNLTPEEIAVVEGTEAKKGGDKRAKPNGKGTKVKDTAKRTVDALIDDYEELD